MVEIEKYGEVKSHELKPGGEKTAVTDENKAEYVESRVQWYLQKQIEQQAEALRRGIYDVLPEEVSSSYQSVHPYRHHMPGLNV